MLAVLNDTHRSQSDHAIPLLQCSSLPYVSITYKIKIKAFLTNVLFSINLLKYNQLEGQMCDLFALYYWTSLVAQMVKHLSTVWETRVRSLGREDPLEKEMAIHSSTIAWKIPWTEEPGRLQPMGSQRVWHDWATLLYLYLTLQWIRDNPNVSIRNLKCFEVTKTFLRGRGWGFEHGNTF